MPPIATPAQAQLIADLSARESAFKASIREKSPVLHWAMQWHRNSRGEVMNFKDMYWLLAIYKNFTRMPHMVIMKSVQGGLSELFISAHFYEAAILGFTVLYVLPKYELRNRFVNNRIEKVIRRVPHYQELVTEGAGAARVSLKHFGKGTIAYLGSNVEDEFVEIPADSAYTDEKDRCNQANLLKVPDRLTASPHKFQREIGNPSIEGFGIDERYQSSNKSVWMIKCDACNHFFVPDFFQHIVRQVDANRWEARAPDYQYREGNEITLSCPKCDKPVNRLKNGEWVAEHPGREWFGLQQSKIIVKYVALNSLVDKWMDSFQHPLRTQVFYNSDLGLPFTSEGSKITAGLLNACQRKYSFPVEKRDVHGPIFMGVDVGGDLNVVIRERCKDDMGTWTRKLLWVGTVPSFTLLKQLIREWNPKMVVIDSMPEIHEVMSLKSEFKQVYSARFQQGLLKINVDRTNRVISMDRTCVIDALRLEFEQQFLVIPEGAEYLDGGNYYSQLQASTRVLITNETNPDKSYYSWEHSTPDHYCFSEAYDLLADLLVPRDSVIDFYAGLVAEHINNTQSFEDAAKQTGQSEDEVKRLAGLNSNQFLKNLQNQYKGPK